MRVPERAVTGKGGLRISLRSPEESDTEAMLSFLRSLFHESSENLNAPADWFDRTTVAEQAAKIRAQLEAPRAFLLCAFHDGSIVGNLSFGGMAAPANGHCGELALGVLASHQARGIGSALLSYCLDTAKARGMWNVRFTVRTHNAAAIRLYERLGFRRIGRLSAVAKVDGKYMDEYLYQGTFSDGVAP